MRDIINIELNLDTISFQPSLQSCVMDSCELSTLGVLSWSLAVVNT